MSEGYRSLSINKYDIEIENSFFDCRIFWAKVISSETQSLFTNYTKHTFYEIQYALEGSIGMVVGENKSVYFDSSYFIIIPPDTYHQIFDGDSQGARFIMAFDIHPKNDKIKLPLRELNSPSAHRESKAMRELLSLILEKSYLDDPIRKSLLNSLIESFLLEIFEVIAPHPSNEQGDDKNAQNDHRISEIKAFISAFNGIGIHVSDVAQRFHLSERQLNRILKASTGKTAKQHIEHEKMKKIEEFAATTELTLKEISELCGFSDEYAMNKFFRRHNKTNLSEFRRIAKLKEKQKSGL